MGSAHPEKPTHLGQPDATYPSLTDRPQEMVAGDRGQRSGQVPRLGGAVYHTALGIRVFVPVGVCVHGCLSMCTYMILCACVCERVRVLVHVCEWVWVYASTSSLAILA